MNEITAKELVQWQQENPSLVLIDVREPHEYEQANLGGTHIPLAEVVERVAEIPREGRVVVHCRAGSRSAAAIRMLEQRFGYTNLYNLQGGILAYASDINPDLDVL